MASVSVFTLRVLLFVVHRVFCISSNFCGSDVFGERGSHTAPCFAIHNGAIFAPVRPTARPRAPGAGRWVSDTGVAAEAGLMLPGCSRFLIFYGIQVLRLIGVSGCSVFEICLWFRFFSSSTFSGCFGLIILSLDCRRVQVLVAYFKMPAPILTWRVSDYAWYFLRVSEKTMI